VVLVVEETVGQMPLLQDTVHLEHQILVVVVVAAILATHLAHLAAQTVVLVDLEL
jgi:hypothetical protein